jgi:hypothetical protein
VLEGAAADTLSAMDSVLLATIINSVVMFAVLLVEIYVLVALAALDIQNSIAITEVSNGHL